MNIADNIAACRAKLPASATLVAVSKKVDGARIEEALRAGQTVFAENYVQEAAQKWPALKARYPQVKLHLIGHLQSNKAEAAVQLFDRIDTLDSEKLAQALSKAMKKTGRTIPVLLEVNIGCEPQKAGVRPEDAAALLAHARAQGLAVEGLMCIPPADLSPAPFFRALKDLAGLLGLPVCSMGMSADYEEAIRHGSNEVRLGTALFGARSE